MSSTNYSKWIRENKEILIDSWECGFHKDQPIDQNTYADFVAWVWSIENANNKMQGLLEAR